MYDVFCPEIRKNALIDSFLRIAAVIDSSASSAGLVVMLLMGWLVGRCEFPGVCWR